MAGKYRVYKGRNGKFYWQLKASNGQVILQSQGYSTKKAAENGIRSAQKNCGSKARFDASEARNGQHYFTLKAANGEVIGTSETYKRVSSCKSGIESVMKNGTTSRIVDETG